MTTGALLYITVFFFFFLPSNRTVRLLYSCKWLVMGGGLTFPWVFVACYFAVFSNPCVPFLCCSVSVRITCGSHNTGGETLWTLPLTLPLPGGFTGTLLCSIVSLILKNLEHIFLLYFNIQL